MNRPFLLFQIELLAMAGITDITLSLSYQPDKIEDQLGDGAEYGVRLSYVTEPNPLGTGGAYKWAFAKEAETALVFNGDILTDFDLSAMIAAHRDKASDATIALTPVIDPSRYGLVETDKCGSVVRFLEKPNPEEIDRLGTNLINAGIYILEPTVLPLIATGENASFEYNVFPEILNRKMGFNSFSLDGSYWKDIGTPESYLTAQMDFLNGDITGSILPKSQNSEIATTAAVDDRSLIAEGCVIKPNAKIINSVLGPGVHVEEKAFIENSVIWAHSRISASADVRGSVICRSCHIGKNVVVGCGSVLGDKTSLPDYSKV